MTDPEGREAPEGQEEGDAIEASYPPEVIPEVGGFVTVGPALGGFVTINPRY